jgi:transglutaminase-like putative cysteine protease
MRTILILFSALLFFHFSQAQPTANYVDVDAFVERFPMKASALADIRVLAREWKGRLHTDEEKARAVFYWITHNIVYDCEGYRNGNGIYEPGEVMQKKKAICAGYASLYKFFCQELGLTCEIINGFATGISVDTLSENKINTNHAWNAVKVSGSWKLVDPTWGAGSANDDCTRQFSKLDEFFFFPDPIVLFLAICLNRKNGNCCQSP